MAWEAGFVALGAVVLVTAYVGLRRRSWRRALLTVVAAVAVAEAADFGFVLLTAFSAPSVLSRVHSLSELVGQRQQRHLATAPGGARPGVQAVVLGDSTAAGVGNPLVAHPSALDRACGRSSAAYAVELARVNGWHVDNLACSGATVTGGLGRQRLGGLLAPAQLAEARRDTGARAVFLSVGADDLRWDVLVRLCAVSPTCDDAPSTAYFQSELHTFGADYYQALGLLAALPGHPVVVVDQYYDPFDPSQHCLDGVGLTAAKVRVLQQRLAALNAVLAKDAGAAASAPCGPTSAATSCARRAPGSRVCTTPPRSTRRRRGSWPSPWPTRPPCGRRRRPPGGRRRPARRRRSSTAAKSFAPR